MGSRRRSRGGRGPGLRSPWTPVILVIVIILGLDFAGWLGGTRSYLFNLILGPRRPPPSMEDMAALVESELASEKPGVGPALRFIDSRGNLHLKIDLSPERYARLSPVLREKLLTAGAVILREQTESDARAVYHLWELRAARGGRTHLLFSCLKVPSGPRKKPVSRKPGRSPRGPALAAIIMDDLGYNLEVVREACALGLPLTVSVLPFSPHAVESAQVAHEHGLEVMLHLPMESREHHQTEEHTEGLLRSDHGPDELREIVRRAIYQVPYIRGVNNHMGSLLTEDGVRMEVILSVLGDYGLYFIDSRTSAASRALETARKLDLPAAGCDLFLDVSGGAAGLRQNLGALLKLAAERGWAVGIVHPYATTLAALRECDDILGEYGVRLVPVSAVLARAAGR